MHRKANKISCVLCTLGALLWLAAICLLPLTVQAASGSLTLICSSSDVSISGMKWNIYKVGERVDESSFELVGDFAGYHVSLTDVTAASQLQDAADTLENYAVLDSIMPLGYSVADAGGAAVFESLEAGLYLLSGESLTIGDMRYVPSAVLIEITEGSEALDITAYAKITGHSLPSSSVVMYSVSKVWQDDDAYISARPESISVELYCDGEPYEEVTLSDDNNWSYTWLSDPLSEWRIMEIQVPDEYNVVYRSNDTQFVAVNTFDESSMQVETTTAAETEATTAGESDTTAESTEAVSDSTDESEETTQSASDSAEEVTESGTAAVGASTVSTTTSGGSSEKLPQTGQLWWPVPVMSAGGLVMLVVGAKLHEKG
ncbi:MAG: Cna B-type domain-containing protein [Ruminococcus sp.]|nr:Cna B-type domain-containing protein [Ruminococcus sp.]